LYPASATASLRPASERFLKGIALLSPDATKTVTIRDGAT
jgi:hypothetical protein